MKTVAYFSLGGAAAGAVVGMAVYMLDPLSPSANFKGSALTGMGIGAIGGMIFSIYQLNRQATMPFDDSDNEFLGDDLGYHYKPHDEEERDILQNAQLEYDSPRYTLFDFKYRF